MPKTHSKTVFRVQSLLTEMFSCCGFRVTLVERMLRYWEGPVTAVVYLTDEELTTLEEKPGKSPVFCARKNITIHLVYKRHVRIHNESLGRSILFVCAFVWYSRVHGAMFFSDFSPSTT